MRKRFTLATIDWPTVILFLLLVAFGWMNIYSTSLHPAAQGYLDFAQIYGKQALWIFLSFMIIIFVLALESKFYERFASAIFVTSLLSLLGLFVFGSTISGSTSWYSIGGFGIQPTEFAKAATALALAKYLSDLQTNIHSFKHQLFAFIIILLPVSLIVLQPDPGSAIVYAAFFFPLYREGLSLGYLLVGLSIVLVFLCTLLFGPLWTSFGLLFITVLALFFKRKKRAKHYLRFILLALIGIGFSFSVTYIFNNVFQQHHRDRFNLVLGKEVDSKGIGYNTHQSEIAIGSGGWSGKGWMQGTQTKGNFVPEQHTDYIFSTVGEEWGFEGSAGVVLLFILLFLRLIYLAERQKTQFSRIYGYSVVGILFVHFFVNIGMVIGIFPTVGIPLPFFSYGGSALWGFTILLFVFLKLDSNRKAYF